MRVIEWLAEAGFPEAQMEELGDLLVIKLDSRDRSRLLAAPALRDGVLFAARSRGFSRVAISLTA